MNQLYCNHRDAIDRLIASGERFHKAQASRLAAKIADMRAALDARREALTTFQIWLEQEGDTSRVWTQLSIRASV